MTLKNQSTLRQSVRGAGQYVCWQCQQRRTITQNYLKRKEEGRLQWIEQAKEIRAGQRKSMFTVLKERGFVHAVAGEEKALDRLMIDKRIGAYVGIDPTAASLHVGHLLPLMALFWMHIHGFHTVSLLGGSTARIGDPTGRTTDRLQMTPTERKANVAAMHYQVKRLWLNVERVSAKHGFQYEKHWRRDLVNNAVWWNTLPFMDVLKIMGRGIRLGPMLGRDTVKTKMASGDGMSFSEFCYPLMQAWDWWHLYEEKGIQLQIGGSDQFGNIVAGIDAVKYVVKSHPDPLMRQENGAQDATAPYGFTVPLLTTAAGVKFGKSAGNAIWLDQAMTSLFDLYAFFVRTADADVERYLKLFTFLPLSEIQSLMDQHKLQPSKRIPHHKLAREFVDLIHGEEAAKRAEEQHLAMFSKNPVESVTTTLKEGKPNPLASNQNANTRLTATYISRHLNKYAEIANHNSAPAQHIILPKSLIYNQSIAKILWAAGLVSSRSEGHRLAESKGAYVGMRSSGKQQMKDDLSFVPAKLRDPDQSWNNVIRDEQNSGEMEKEGEEGLLILRVGKWKVRVVRVVSDKKFEEMDIEKPQLWTELKSKGAADRAEESLKTAKESKAPRSKVDDPPEEIEILSDEDTAHLREDITSTPVAAKGAAKPEKTSRRKQQWESLLEQQTKGRQEYYGLAGNTKRSTERDAGPQWQASAVSRSNPSETSLDQYPNTRPTPTPRSPEATQAFKNLVGMIDPLEPTTGQNDDATKSVIRRIGGDSTYPSVGRLAAMQAPDPEDALDNYVVKRFGGATQADKRKIAAGARRKGKLVGGRREEGRGR